VIERAMSAKHRNIRYQAYQVDSEEKVAWMLYCKLKQKKHELELLK
jgi:hypothetical protein